jgi:uncharacterized protein YjbJ (UPF0337 family)
MKAHLDKLKGSIKATIGALIGSRRLEVTGVADLARARARRQTTTRTRLTTASFRESVGQMTANERRATEGKGDNSASRSALRRTITSFLS